MAELQSADLAWLVILGGAVVFEFASDDVLSDSTARLCARHPILSRLVILSIAGHLSCVLPPLFDVFSAKNLVHRSVMLSYRQSKRMMNVKRKQAHSARSEWQYL
jgi:hypothetical protein